MIQQEQALLEIKKINKIYHGERKVHALADIDLQVGQQEFVCLLGPSGCGKSTLLSLVAGLEHPTTGQIFYQGSRVHGASRERTVVFQEAALFPWLRVQENIEFGLKMRGFSKHECQQRAIKLLEKVKLQDFSQAFIHQLSGGMRQRVAIARALAMDAGLLLMDEPFSALDSQTRLLLQRELVELWQQCGNSVLFVTHNPEEAVLLADRIVMMSNRPGKINKIIPVDLLRPREIFLSREQGILRDIRSIMQEEAA
jgi:NitT/TauT family transport system ATP-binding protein